MRRLLLISVLLATSAFALPPNVEQLDTYKGVTQYRLKSNQMTLLLVPDHTSPVFTFMVVYHVGSRNEAPGNTGSAHLLEHMIFNKSTEHFGRAKGHKTFQEVLYEAGADFSSTNMTTWYDRMNGYSTLPSDKLELAMQIEADRLGRALIIDTERQSEMSVVRNEYEISENNPFQVLLKSTVAAAIQAHPYHWSTIGYRSDIEGVSTDQLRAHYKNFFWPNNAEAVLVGDFDPDAALALFDREFGSFAPSPQPIPRVITVEPPQEGERRAVVQRPGTIGMVMLGYMRPGASHPDFMPFEVLASILSDGVNARLNRALVETGLATSVNANNFALRDPYPFLVDATLAGGKTHAEVESALKAALADVATNGVTDEELKRAQKQLELAVTRGRDGTYQYAANLGEAIASANWKWFLDYVDAVNAVTKDDIKRVAATYLIPNHATVGWFVPTANTKTADAAVPATPAASPARIGSASSTETATTKAAKPAPAKTTFAQRTTHRVLRNGITLDIVENHARPTVALRGVVFAGDTAAPANQPAIAALTAKMLERGTKTRTKEEIGRLIDDVGATLYFTPAATEVSIVSTGMARDLPLVLDVLGDELQHPAFAADELAKAKKEYETDVLRADDNTSQRAMERLNQLVYPEGHPYHPAGREKLLASSNAIGAEQLRAFHAAHYNGAGLILAIVGDVDTAKTIALVEKLLGGLPKGERVSFTQLARTNASTGGAREALTMRGKANMNIVMGSASGLRRTDPDYEAALVANAALGQNALSSRIGKRVRDTEGLSYNLFSRFGADLIDGLWYVNVNVAPQNLAKAMQSTREEIDKFAREGVTDEEVAAQKSFFAGNYQVGLGSNGGIAAALASAEKYGFGPKYLDEFPARVRAVTKDQVNAAMRAHLFADKLNLIVAGDLEKLP
ncbi:MAG: insulinase family protein [Acidobacteria bacterium]|nr:insulinase family protein [Acidobacteriota bacterium]MBV9070630.1 insulinase family protein [Acidobacteriota bacterium]MBV9478183.1 insulinase family protein [Acidobacteriota bacterium]